METNASVVRLKFCFSILISGNIIKEMPCSVASGTPWINVCLDTFKVIEMIVMSVMSHFFSGNTSVNISSLNATNHKDPDGVLPAFSWHYVQCPPENECVNNHHTCDNISEQCVDLPEGFKCVCGQGYKFEK